MPLDRFTGPNLTVLLARATSEIGADAVVLSVRKTFDELARPEFELIAADPETAEARKRETLIPSRFPTEMTCMAPAPTSEGRIMIAIVGPTGAGKTTTIVKLANHPGVFGTRSVGFVCLDTYRIGGMEQLKIYAALSRVPVETVYETKDIPRALRRLRGSDVILIDTPGRGPGQSEDAAAAQALLRLLRPDEIHLAIPAGLRRSVARGIVEAHRPYGITHLVATKIDECSEDRNVFDLATEFELPMRWVADGQMIPDSVRAAVATPPVEAVAPHVARLFGGRAKARAR